MSAPSCRPPDNGRSYERADIKLVGAGYSEADKITLIVTNKSLADPMANAMWVEGTNVIIVRLGGVTGRTVLHELGHVIDYIGTGDMIGGVKVFGHSKDKSNIMYHATDGGVMFDAEYHGKFRQFVNGGSKW